MPAPLKLNAKDRVAGHEEGDKGDPCHGGCKGLLDGSVEHWMSPVTQMVSDVGVETGSKGSAACLRLSAPERRLAWLRPSSGPFGSPSGR